MVVFLIILVIVVIGIFIYSIKMMMDGVSHSVEIPDTVFDKYNKMREKSVKISHSNINKYKRPNKIVHASKRYMRK